MLQVVMTSKRGNVIIYETVSCCDVTEELDDYFRAITSLSSVDREYRVQEERRYYFCRSQFRELGGVFVAASVMPAIVRDVLLHIRSTVCERVRIFDCWKDGIRGLLPSHPFIK